MSDIVVVGSGQAGAALVAKLRHLGHEGAITLIGEEPVAPYPRPPLSKAYLLGDMTLERLYLRPETFYPEHDITLVKGTRVDAIDREAKRVHTITLSYTFYEIDLPEEVTALDEPPQQQVN